jgi:hypothetical protein
MCRNYETEKNDEHILLFRKIVIFSGDRACSRQKIDRVIDLNGRGYSFHVVTVGIVGKSIICFIIMTLVCLSNKYLGHFNMYILSCTHSSSTHRIVHIKWIVETKTLKFPAYFLLPCQRRK